MEYSIDALTKNSDMNDIIDKIKDYITENNNNVEVSFFEENYEIEHDDLIVLRGEFEIIGSYVKQFANENKLRYFSEFDVEETYKYRTAVIGPVVDKDVVEE